MPKSYSKLSDVQLLSTTRKLCDKLASYQNKLLFIENSNGEVKLNMKKAEVLEFKLAFNELKSRGYDETELRQDFAYVY